MLLVYMYILEELSDCLVLIVYPVLSIHYSLILQSFQSTSLELGINHPHVI